MKNTWQLQCPAGVDYQQYLYEEVGRIRGLKVSSKVKAKMLGGLICLVKEKEQVEKVKAQQNISTSFSEQQSNFTVYENEIQDLEDRILQKRAIKFQINQEIEGVEEDLFQIQKIVDTKRDYDDYLRKQIDFRMKSIERTEQKHAESSYLDKSFKAVTGIFKGWLY